MKAVGSMGAGVPVLSEGAKGELANVGTNVSEAIGNGYGDVGIGQVGTGYGSVTVAVGVNVTVAVAVAVAVAVGVGVFSG